MLGFCLYAATTAVALSAPITATAAPPTPAVSPGAVPSAGYDCSRPPGPRLGWATAQQRLLACNREILSARQAVTAARADVLIAGQRQNPTLSLGAESISPSEGIGAGGPLDKQIDYTARIDQTFERGGKRRHRVDAAGQALRAAAWTAADKVRQVELALGDAWIGLWGAQERLGLHQELATLYERTVDGARRRLKAGDISAADLARIELEAQHAAAQRAVAEGERIEARNVLAALLAMEAGAVTLEVVEPWPALGDRGGDEGREGGRSGGRIGGRGGGSSGRNAGAPPLRPDLQAARAGAAAAAARLRLAQSLQTRDVTVGVQSERYARPAGNGWSMGLFVSVPLFVHHRSEGEIALAGAERDQADLEADRLEREAIADQRRLLDALEVARANRERLERQALPLAQRVASDAELSFRKGAGTVLELLDALRLLRTMQLDTLEARLTEDRADAAARAAMLSPGAEADPVFGGVLSEWPGP